jgi:thiamine kinase-like enzyme
MNERSPNEVLDGIPGWEGATYGEIAGGLTNRAWLVEKDDRRAVLKIDHKPRVVPLNSREDERRLQTVVAKHDLAAHVLFDEECAYLTEYIDGHVWSRKDLNDQQNLADLAAALKQLHALPLTGRTFDANATVDWYLGRIEDQQTETVRKIADVVLSRGLPPNLCCCHNDLVAENIIRSGSVQFLDWEYACDNDPFFDLATVITHHDLSAELSSLFLNVYFGGDGERWRSQLQKQMYVYDALHWLWLAGRSQSEADKEQLDLLAARLDAIF